MKGTNQSITLIGLVSLSTRARLLSSSTSVVRRRADVHDYKAVAAPVPSAYPNVARWHAHISLYHSEFDTSAPPAAAEDDEDIDLFGEDEDEEAEKSRPNALLRSVVILEVKPCDDETDMQALERAVQSIEQEGLVWGASKLVAIGYGIKKLQITLVVEDELVSLDELQEKIAEFDDYIQSSVVAAMQCM
ncbi:hypothetical protein HD554DRAFT_2205175 [Boletus coccyginus]|nr:hypothetical protein HD554DRAFT_2205175 [Boletus coccyginus]